MLAGIGHGASAWPGRRRCLPGLALSLSSTAFALQVLEEKGELALRHGRLAFAVLLFQDLAAIPLIALVPLFAVRRAAPRRPMDSAPACRPSASSSRVVVVGRYLLDGVYPPRRRAPRVKEAMTASALLTVVGVTLVMEEAGLSASLGAFIAGVLLADSDYRHEIEADIAPFEGLLLGLFFTAIGMSLNLELLVDKAAAARRHRRRPAGDQGRRPLRARPPVGIEVGPARRLGLAISQGGEFAFVLFAAGSRAGRARAARRRSA